MIFNSFDFLWFLLLAFLIHWKLCGTLRSQNIFLLISSYIFYGWWDERFLILILASTVFDYLIGRKLAATTKLSLRKWLLASSLVFNLGLLAFFKYFNFFIESWVDAWQLLGVEMHASTLQIILPVGISFYTFQTLSYTIDIYRKKMEPSDSFIKFAAFVSFFPQLVAGPIERASNLLPQFDTKRKFNYNQAISGLKLILWGLLKKMVIADSCAIYANEIFDGYENYGSLTLILGAVYFAFQIYGDFSGYSDIAIGTARLFGVKLMVNFKQPYFSRDIAEFWRRWHISLSTWFRDYLYIPLGGSRGSKAQQLRNVSIIFLVSGFWHGANWTFIVWGALNALYFFPLLLAKKNRNHLEDITVNNVRSLTKTIPRILLTFSLTCIGWIFFRADTVGQAWNYILRMASLEKINLFTYLPSDRYPIELMFLLAIFVLFEWFHRGKETPFVGNSVKLKVTMVILAILTLGVYSNYQEFIYFQF